MEQEFRVEGVRGVLHRPEAPNDDAIVLTHGAGSDCNAPLLVQLGSAFSDAGYLVLRYDLPFRQKRPKGPPFGASAAQDREGVVGAVEAVRTLVRGRVLAGGHSYGGRQTAMAAAENFGLADGLLLLSYPLHPPKRPEQKRMDFFPELRVPALFVHGTADPFGSLEELRDAMASISGPTDLMPVEGAGHDLKRAAGLAAEMLSRIHALIGA